MWSMSSLQLGYETKTIPHCSYVLKNHLRGRKMSHQRKQHYSSRHPFLFKPSTAGDLRLHDILYAHNDVAG